jgi:gamma-glutamyltranspeptidase/glutathione hydrolase
MLQALSILKNFPLKNLGHNTAHYLHVVVEAVKLAQTGSSSKGIKALLPAVERIGGSLWGPGTVHVDAMDHSGYTAAFTPSGAYLKCGEVVPALGFPLGARLPFRILDRSLAL